MISATQTNTSYDQLPVSSERTLPTAPYPRCYVHCVMASLSDAVQTVYTLRASGYDAKDIHIMASWDYIEAFERAYQQRGLLSKWLWRLASFFDEGFGDTYLRAAQQGQHVLAIRLSSRLQVESVRRVLVSHHACLMKYVDAWAVADLSTDQGSSALSYALERVFDL